jgi:hypothetical protein
LLPPVKGGQGDLISKPLASQPQRGPVPIGCRLPTADYQARCARGRRRHAIDTGKASTSARYAALAGITLKEGRDRTTSVPTREYFAFKHGKIMRISIFHPILHLTTIWVMSKHSHRPIRLEFCGSNPAQILLLHEQPLCFL